MSIVKHTKSFKNISKNDVAVVGGKGASLGEMTEAGFSIPQGFVILTPAFDEFSKNKKISKDLANEILKEFKKLKTKHVAVRSSATAEDSSTASWAGELETYLNTTEKNLLENIKKCWMSLYSSRAVFYRQEKGLSDTKISVAVVVQKMVQSDVSGICFTVHPVTGNKNQMVIEAGWGLGEAIVGGKITPDTYVVKKLKLDSRFRGNDSGILDKNISEQKIMIIRKGNKTRKTEVPKLKIKKQKLTDNQIIELAKICQQVERHYKKPQDIEWALENDKFYILQSRPITTL